MRGKAFFSVIIGIALIIGGVGFAFAQTSPNPNGYFVNINGLATGPYDSSGLRQLINQGQLSANTLVWKAGMSDWAPAGTVNELAPLFPQVTSPAPAAVPDQVVQENPQPISEQVQQESPPPQVPSRDHEETVQSSGKWYNSFGTGLQNNWVFINAGVGFGPTGDYNMDIPPISASIDVKVSKKIPLTFGVMGIFSTWKWTYGYLPRNDDVTYMNIGIGGRLMYHFNFARDLDFYIGPIFGYVIQIVKTEYGSGWDYFREYSSSGYIINEERPYYGGNPFFLYGGNIGIRYFFTKVFGVYVEGGYSGLQYVSGGLTLKL